MRNRKTESQKLKREIERHIERERQTDRGTERHIDRDRHKQRREKIVRKILLFYSESNYRRIQFLLSLTSVNTGYRHELHSHQLII